MDVTECQSQLFQFLSGVSSNANDGEVKAETELLATGVLDSLNLFMLISFIEDELGVEIDPDEVTPENFASVQVISDLIARKSLVAA